jgi:hypothetical protein
VANRISPPGGTLLGFGSPTIERFQNAYYTTLRGNESRFGNEILTPPDPVTVSGAIGYPIGADYTSDKSGPTKGDFGTVTGNSPIGHPFARFRTGTRIQEQRDTVFTINTAVREAYRDSGVSDSDDDNRDLVSANGITGGTTAFENAWFNDTWFSDLWFNNTWFNTIVVYTGNANITEDGDDVTATGAVEMGASASITEDHDTVDSYGSTGNDVRGEGIVFEDADTVSSTTRVIVSATATVLEDRDTVSATSGGDTVRVLLTWEIYGGMTQIDIYRSDDNVTFTKVETVSGATTSYIDENVVLGQTYYYYLEGKQTTGAATDSSDTESITTPN